MSTKIQKEERLKLWATGRAFEFENRLWVVKESLYCGFINNKGREVLALMVFATAQTGSGTIVHYPYNSPEDGFDTLVYSN